MIVELKLADYLAMVKHARELAPIEDCGLIAGTIADGKKKQQKYFI